MAVTGNTEQETGQGGNGPALAVVRSHRIAGRPDTRRIKIGFAEEVDAREKAERRLVRRPDRQQLLNDVIGSNSYYTNFGWGDWTLPNGDRFTVTRFYKGQGIAVDFAATERDEEIAEAKGRRLKELGILHIFLSRGKSIKAEELEEIIRQFREKKAKEDGHAED